MSIDGLDIEDLTQMIGRVCAGDFSQRPPIPEDDDEVGRFLAGLRFLVDEFELARQHRDDEIRRWREIDRVKTRFINTAAHELGTPLTPIMLQIHRMRSLTDEPDLLRSVDVVDRNIHRIARLVDDLLDVAKLESGRLPIRPRPTDLAKILDDVLESSEEAASQRRIALHLELEEEVHVAVDADRFHQVLQNLVDNALKFTPSGGRVTLRLRRAGEEAHVDVHDTGIGMTGEQIVRLFQPFSQVHDANPHDITTGSGLGLFICKGLIEQHGGIIWCESPGPGQGSSFHIVLPALAASAKKGGAPAPEADGAGLTAEGRVA